MKCQGCNQDFPNLNALTRHKKTCGQEDQPNTPAADLPDEEPTNIDGYSVVLVQDGGEIVDSWVVPGDNAAGCVIPLALCPEEVKLFALGHTFGLRVEGELTPNGIAIREVKLIR